MKIEKLNENLDHIEMVDKTYDVVSHTYATAVRDHKSNVERITKMMKERSKDAVQGERQPKTIKNAMLKRMHLSESIFDATHPLGKQKEHNAIQNRLALRQTISEAKGDDIVDDDDWYDMASFIEDHLSRSDITRPDEQILTRIARISDVNGVSYRNLGRDKNNWVTARVPLGKYDEDTNEIEISDNEETQANARVRADKVIEAAHKIADMYKLGFESNKNANKKFYEFKIEVPMDSIGQVYCVGDWFEENNLDLSMALTPAYQKRLAKREQLFANPDKNEEFLGKVKTEALGNRDGDFTIEIAGEIHCDEDGNAYHFTTSEEAKKFIEEQELENAEVTRQHGKAKNESLKPLKESPMVNLSDEEYAKVMKDREANKSNEVQGRRDRHSLMNDLKNRQNAQRQADDDRAKRREQEFNELKRQIKGLSNRIKDIVEILDELSQEGIVIWGWNNECFSVKVNNVALCGGSGQGITIVPHSGSVYKATKCYPYKIENIRIRLDDGETGYKRYPCEFVNIDGYGNILPPDDDYTKNPSGFERYLNYIKTFIGAFDKFEDALYDKMEKIAKSPIKESLKNRLNKKSLKKGKAGHKMNESLTEGLKYGQTKYEELVGKIREYWDAPAIDNLCDLMKDIDEQAAYDLIYKCAEFLEEHADEAIEDSQKYPIEKPKAKDSTFVSAKDKQPKKGLLTESTGFDAILPLVKDWFGSFIGDEDCENIAQAFAMGLDEGEDCFEILARVCEDYELEAAEFEGICPEIEELSSGLNESVVMNEEAKIITSLDDYISWGGATETWDRISDEDKIEELDSLLEELYPDGISLTELNDLLWFEQDWIYEQLGIAEDEEDEED